MQKLGDNWTMKKITSHAGFYTGNPAKNLEFNVIAMDAVQHKNYKISTNHFWNATDFEPSTNWQGGFQGHLSKVGQAVINVLLDNGSSTTVRAILPEMKQKNINVWNARSTGDGGSMFLIPRSLSTGKE
jgi:hypothetical protein